MALSVGIDVAKQTLEWNVSGEEKIQHVLNEPRPIAQLARQLVAVDPTRIVVESTGGYERTLVSKLAEAGLPVVVVNPRRVRSFGQAMGILAKTDAIDTRLLALFGEKAEPPIRPILQGRPASWPISWPVAGSSSRCSSPRRTAARPPRPQCAVP